MKRKDKIIVDKLFLMFDENNEYEYGLLETPIKEIRDKYSFGYELLCVIFLVIRLMKIKNLLNNAITIQFKEGELSVLSFEGIGCDTFKIYLEKESRYSPGMICILSPRYIDIDHCLYQKIFNIYEISNQEENI